MAERQVFIDRVKGAEREYLVTADALSHYEPAALAGEIDLPPKTSLRDLVAATERAESTYLIRMWAEFETALRSYRRRITGNEEDQIRAIHLVNWTAGVKQGRPISEDVRDEVHEVRKYRNFLVHEREDEAPPPPITIQEARKRLNTLLHCLPIAW